MRASKEEAAKCQESLDAILRQCDKLPMVYKTGGSRINAEDWKTLRIHVEQIREFLQAAYRKLPVEDSYRRASQDRQGGKGPKSLTS